MKYEIKKKFNCLEYILNDDYLRVKEISRFSQSYDISLHLDGVRLPHGEVYNRQQKMTWLTVIGLIIFAAPIVVKVRDTNFDELLLYSIMFCGILISVISTFIQKKNRKLVYYNKDNIIIFEIEEAKNLEKEFEVFIEALENKIKKKTEPTGVPEASQAQPSLLAIKPGSTVGAACTRD